MILLLFLWLADPQQAKILLQQGLVAMQKGQTTQARDLLEQASRANADNAYVWSSLAEVYLRLKESNQSSAAAKKAEKLGVSDPMVCHALAMYYSESNQPGRAAPFEQKFAESGRGDPAALGRAAGLYLVAGANDKALALAQKAIQLQDSPLNESVLGRALVASGHEQQALPYLRGAWESSKSDEEMTFAYANALLRAQAFTEAADAVTTAINQHPPDAQLELLLGVARYGQRRFEDAITTFLEVIKLDPEVEQPYLFLGRLLEQATAHLGDIITADRKWANRNPRNPKAQLELAKALLQQNRTDAEAAGLLQTSIRLDDNDWEPHYQLGVYLEGKRDFPASAEQLSKSSLLDPKQPMPHYHLARVYDRLGETEKAEAERSIHSKLTAASKEHPN